MNPPPQSTGYLVIALATVLATIESFSISAHDLTMLIWSLLVLGSVVVLSAEK